MNHHSVISRAYPAERTVGHHQIKEGQPTYPGRWSTHLLPAPMNPERGLRAEDQRTSEEKK